MNYKFVTNPSVSYLWDLHTCDKNGNALLWLCSISEEDSREILCLCWKVPYDVINLTLSNLGQSGCVPLAWSCVRGRATPIPDETGRLFSVFVMDVVFKAWKHSFSLSLLYTQCVPLYLFLQQGSRSWRAEGDLWLGRGLQHRTWELPLTPARVLCCSQWNCCTVHIRDGSITLGELYTMWLPVKSFLFSSSSERKTQSC